MGTPWTRACWFLPSADASKSTISACKPRVAAIRRSFEHRGLLYREIRGSGQPWDREGAFILCTCWLVDFLVLSGKRDEADELLKRLAGCANDLGLLAEEIDPASGDLLGNFPQGFSHLGITRSILNIACSNNPAS